MQESIHKTCMAFCSIVLLFVQNTGTLNRVALLDRM